MREEEGKKEVTDDGRVSPELRDHGPWLRSSSKTLPPAAWRCEVVEAGALTGALGGVAGSGAGRGKEVAREAPDARKKQARRRGGKEEDDAGRGLECAGGSRLRVGASNVIKTYLSSSVFHNEVNVL